MKRSVYGFAMCAVAVGLLSCGGDPTESIREGEKILADPSAVFVQHGGTDSVVVELVDGQGNQLTADFTPQNVGPGITVEKDLSYLETSTGQPISTSQRYVVTGLDPMASSFELATGGQSITIPVTVTPAGTTVSLSNPAPIANEGLVITLPAGYRFGAGAGASVAGDPGITTAIAPDSSSVTVVLPPGSTGSVTVDSVQVDYLPGVLFSLPTTETVTVGPATALPGSGGAAFAAPASAPSLPIPAAGGTTGTYDLPDFTATIDHYYKLDITEAGDYTITVDWSIGSDVDAPICVSDPTCAAEDFGDPTVSSSKPETGTFTLPVGTHILWVEDYGGDAAGATLSIVISRP